MIVSNNVDLFLKYFINHLHFLGKLQIGAIKEMVDYKGQGSEYISCSFDPEDEDFRDGYVVLYFWKPAVDKDTMVYVENRKFFEGILAASEQLVKVEPQVKDKSEKYLKKLKDILNLV